MSEVIDHMKLQKKFFYDKSHNFLNVFCSDNLYKSIFNELKSILLKKEIKFNNITTKEQRDDDKDFICNNFTTNSLLNILNEKNNISNINNTDMIKNYNIIKKKNRNYNTKFNTVKILNDIKKFLLNSIEKKRKILKNKSVNNSVIEKKNVVGNNYILKEINTKKKIYDQTRRKFLNTGHTKSIINKKNSFFIKSPKNINRINYSYSEKNLFKNTYKTNNRQSIIKPLFLNYEKNLTIWKKEINKTILLSISNNNNEVNIHLKPENLGSIFIKINIKKNRAVLNFTSNHKKIRILLDNYIPILRDSLMNHGIFVKQVNIHNNIFFKDKNDINKIFSSSDNSVMKHNLIKIFKKNQKNIEKIKYKTIDVYV